MFTCSFSCFLTIKTITYSDLYVQISKTIQLKSYSLSMNYFTVSFISSLRKPNVTMILRRELTKPDLFKNRVPLPLLICRNKFIVSINNRIVIYKCFDYEINSKHINTVFQPICRKCNKCSPSYLNSKRPHKFDKTTDTDEVKFVNNIMQIKYEL